jgi:hypothetical protein
MTDDYRPKIKTDLNNMGKTIADLSRASGIPYKRLSGFFCSYWYLNQDDERKLRNVLLLWHDEETSKIDSTRQAT